MNEDVIYSAKRSLVIVLNAHEPTEEKNYDSKDSFYEELKQVFDHFLNYHMKILLEDFNVKLERENIFKPKIGNKSLHEDSIDNVVRVVNFATSKNLVAKSTMFPHQSFTNTPGPLLMRRLTIRLITY
jgi:hypothetical protein